jgi:hypothetical protein
MLLLLLRLLLLRMLLLFEVVREEHGKMRR